MLEAVGSAFCSRRSGFGQSMGQHLTSTWWGGYSGEQRAIKAFGDLVRAIEKSAALFSKRSIEATTAQRPRRGSGYFSGISRKLRG